MPTELERRRPTLPSWPFPAAQTFVGACWIYYVFSLWLGHGIAKGGGLFLGSPTNPAFRAAGWLDPVAVVQGGEWERLVTAVLLHGGLLHIIFNSSAILQLGTILEMFTSRSRAFLVLFVSGLTGSLTSVLWAKFVPLLHLSGSLAHIFGGGGFSVGASGAGCGLGAALVALHWGAKDGPLAEFRKQIMTWLIVWLALGFVPQISGTGHLGGAIGGALTGWLLSKRGSVEIIGRDRLSAFLRIACIVLAVAYVGAAGFRMIQAPGRYRQINEQSLLLSEFDKVGGWFRSGPPATDEVAGWVERIREEDLLPGNGALRDALTELVEKLGWAAGRTPTFPERSSAEDQFEQIGERLLAGLRR